MTKTRAAIIALLSGIALEALSWCSWAYGQTHQAVPTPPVSPIITGVFGLACATLGMLGVVLAAALGLFGIRIQTRANKETEDEKLRASRADSLRLEEDGFRKDLAERLAKVEADRDRLQVRQEEMQVALELIRSVLTKYACTHAADPEKPCPNRKNGIRALLEGSEK